jgi:hypothetical protein
VKYPLCIEEPLSEGQGYYSKGHHDPAAFIAALNAELAEGGELDYECSDPYPPEYAQCVQHQYWRKGQDAFCRGMEWAWTVYEYDEPGRGRFPVTVLWSDRVARMMLAKRRERGE